MAPYVGAPEIKARRLVLAVEYHGQIGNPGWNVCGVIITTNHKSDGLHLPADDRRHFVAWSDLTKDDFTSQYFEDLYEWFDNGGNRHVAAYLQRFDLSNFKAKAPPVKTPAFWDIADANQAPEGAELADAVERLGSPSAVTLADLTDVAAAGLVEWLKDRKNTRRIPRRMEDAGYVRVRNPDATDNLWRLNGRRQAIYARRDLLPRERLAEARAVLASGPARRKLSPRDRLAAAGAVPSGPEQ